MIQMQRLSCKAFDESYYKSPDNKGSRYSLTMQKAAQPVDVLNEIIRANGWTQRDLSDRIGVSLTTVNRWINGATRLTDRKLRTVIATLGLDPETYGLDSAGTPVKALGGQEASGLEALELRLQQRFDVIDTELKNVALDQAEIKRLLNLIDTKLHED